MQIQYFINDIPDDFEFIGDLAIDTEAMGLKLQRDRLCVIQIADANKKVCLIHFPDNNYNYECKNLKKYLLNKDIQKIFHFGRFDISIIRKYLNIDEIQNVYCTKIASRFTRTYTDSHSLRSLVGEIMKIDLKKEQQCSYWGAQNLSEAQKTYAANDVIYLHDIRNALNKILEKYNRTEIANKFFQFLNNICTADLLDFNEDIFRHTDRDFKN